MSRATCCATATASLAGTSENGCETWTSKKCCRPSLALAASLCGTGHWLDSARASLRRALRSYFGYYHKSRTHLSLGKDSPEPRPIQPVEMGRVVVAVPQVGGLHHRYERRAA